MPRGTLEVILISAKDLKDSDFFSKLCKLINSVVDRIFSVS